MKTKSAIVATAMLLVGVAAAANAQQDSSRAGQRQQVNADTSMKKQGKQWGTDSATPSGKQGVHEQDAVSGKNAAKTGQDSLKAGGDTMRTGVPKTRSDSVSSSSSSSRPQQSSSSDTSSGSTSTYSNPSSPSGSTTSPNSSSSTSGATASPTSSSVDANGRSTLSLASWMENVAAAAKDQEISKNGQAPGASAGNVQPSSSSTTSSSVASPSGSSTSGVTTSSANSAYQMQDAKPSDGQTKKSVENSAINDASHVSGAATGTTGQQANAPNRTENRDNATTKSTSP